MRAIDADALKPALRKLLDHYGCRPDDFATGKCTGLVDAMDIIDAAPTIDTIPVEWLEAQIKPYTGDVSDIGKSARNGTIKKLVQAWQKEREVHST